MALSFVAVVGAARRLVTPGKVLAAGALVLLLLVPFHAAIGSRVFGQTRGVVYSQNARLPLISLSWKMIQDRPLLGVGVNNFAPSISRYAGPEFTGAWLRSVHNTYLLVWAEAGFAALVALLWFLVSALRRGWRIVARADRLFSPVALGLTGSVLSAMTTMVTERFIGRPLVTLLWLIAALLVATEVLAPLPAAEPVVRGNLNRQHERKLVRT